MRLVFLCLLLTSAVFSGSGVAQTVSAAQPEVPRFLLQVGVDDYQHIRDLRGCRNDLTDLRGVLERRYSSAAQKWQVVTLTDAQATREAILRQFRAHLIANAQKYRHAVVVFQFSGHGSQVKDLDGDEPDGYDETLIPVDSRDPPGKVSDITDDEINGLFQELRQYTNNITFILDSCHSGTATRGDLTRQIPPDSRQIGLAPAQAKPAPARDRPNIDLLPPGNGYVTISAALSTEVALEIKTETAAGVKQNGALTHFLVRALESAGPETTYRQLMTEVAAAVTREKPQHPQVEGDLDRALFGGTARSNEPSIALKAITGARLTLNGGAVLGLREGMLLAVYAPDAKTLRGAAGQLASATVTRVDALTAEAEMPTENKAVTLAARVVPVSPNFGLAPLRVANEAGLPAAFAQDLAERRLVTLTTSDAYLAARRGKFGEVFKNITLTPPKNGKLPDATEEIYYLDKGAGPEFGFYARASLPDAPNLVAEALEKAAKQRNLASLSNALAPRELAQGLKLTVLVGTQFRRRAAGDGFDLTDATVLQTGAADYLLPQKQLFQIRVENTGPRDVFVTLFDLSQDGSVKIIYPPRGAQEALKANGGSVTTPIYQTSGPAGNEMFKLIATTDYVDFGILEQSGAQARNVSPLSQLLQQAFGQVKTRSFGLAANADTWATAEISFRISNEVKR